MGTSNMDDTTKEQILGCEEIGVFQDSALFLDDVENEKAAKKLRRFVQLTDERMGMLLEALPVGMALHQEQSIVFANKALSRLLGYNQQELIGKHCLDFIKSDFCEDLIERFARVFTHGNPINEPGLTVVGEDGTQNTIHLYISLVPWEGRPVAQVVIQDVSHIQVMEQVMHKQAQELASALFAETRARQAQREFVSVISHEFRTPLTIIDGSAQMISRAMAMGKTEKIEAKTAKIRNATVRMSRLIDDILASSSIEKSAFKISPELFDFGALVEEQCNQIGGACESHELLLDMDGLPGTIRADKKACTHIIDNLLSNAIKYSPDADTVELKGWQEDDLIYLSIKDYGVGVPEEEHDELFGQYFRASTSRAFRGTGIGLNLVKNLLHLQGGEIAVESVVDEGSIFTISLPIKGGRKRSQDMNNTLKRF